MQTSSGTAVEGATVSVDGKGWSGVTDASGIFDFGEVPPDTYTITGQRNEYGPALASQTQAAAAGTSVQFLLALDPITVELVIQTPLLTLKHANQSKIEIVIKPSSVGAEAYRIEVRRALQTTWCTLATTALLEPFTGKIAGVFKIRGMAKINGVEKFTAEMDLTVRFPNYSEVIGDPGVSAQLSTAWTNTLSDCTATPNQRREQGFWIRLNTVSATYEFTATLFGPWSGPSGGASVNLPPRPADTPATPLPCDSGATYSIASFHTHTPTEFRTGPGLDGGTRGIGPSLADNRADTTDGVPGVVYDFVESPAGSGSIPMGHPKNSRAQIYLSLGVNPRNTPP